MAVCKMARLTTGDKVQRVLALLRGFGTSRRIRRAMAARGLDAAEIDKGWRLLRQACSMKLDAEHPEVVDSPVVRNLDAWENYWFPIIAVTLVSHFPAVHARVFLNLLQSEGLEVIVTVGTMLKRLEQIAGDAEGQQALALLNKRGLTPEVLGEARGMLQEVATPVEALPEPEPPAHDPEQAMGELWAWYLEWSTIAQQVITNRKELRSLGYLKVQRRSDEEEEETAPSPAAPMASAVTPAPVPTLGV